MDMIDKLWVFTVGHLYHFVRECFKNGKTIAVRVDTQICFVVERYIFRNIKITEKLNTN